MEDTYLRIATAISSAAQVKSPKRLLVGVAGPPGSGKSTVADRVAQIINSSPPSTASKSARAQTVSLDGFHYSRAVLDSFQNREEAYVRRGAPWTFDIDGIVAFMNDVFESANLAPAERLKIMAPSFDHAIKDPKDNDVTIEPETSIVILDGNYLLLDEDKWRTLSSRLDVKIFINIDPALARERVARRHVAAGIEPTLAKGKERFDTNDGINGDLIRQKLVAHDILVESISEPAPDEGGRG